MTNPRDDVMDDISMDLPEGTAAMIVRILDDDEMAVVAAASLEQSNLTDRAAFFVAVMAYAIEHHPDIVTDLQKKFLEDMIPGEDDDDDNKLSSMVPQGNA